MPRRKRNDSSDDDDNFDEDQLYDDNDNEPPYFPKNALKPPNSTTYSVELLWAMMSAGDIDLDPEYQRGFVWTEPKQVALIDSLMLNYYIPPVIFRTIPANGEGESTSDKMICIDGKQRLTSIKRFIAGEIYHRDNMTGIRYWSPRVQRLEKKSRDKILPHNIFSQFLRKQIVCVEYRELNENQERDIFNRVQMGMPLSSAEKMSAILSERALFVRNLRKKLDEWPAKVKMAEDRNRLFQSVGHVVWTVESLPKWSSISNPQLDKWLRADGAINNPNGLEQDIDLMITLAQDYADVAFPSSISGKLAPVEFIFCTVLVHLYKSELDLSQLARAISDTRKAVREQHEDIRSNNRVVASFQSYLSGELARQVRTGVYSKAGLTTPLVKRKRPTAQGDDDEYVVGMSDMELEGSTPQVPRKRRVIDVGSGDGILTPRKTASPSLSRSVVSSVPATVGGGSNPRTVAPMKPFSAQSSETPGYHNYGWGTDGLQSLR